MNKPTYHIDSLPSNIDIFIDKFKEQHPDWTADSYVEVVRLKDA